MERTRTVSSAETRWKRFDRVQLCSIGKNIEEKWLHRRFHSNESLFSLFSKIESLPTELSAEKWMTTIRRRSTNQSNADHWRTSFSFSIDRWQERSTSVRSLRLTSRWGRTNPDLFNRSLIGNRQRKQRLAKRNQTNFISDISLSRVTDTMPRKLMMMMKRSSEAEARLCQVSNFPFAERRKRMERVERDQSSIPPVST